MKNIWNAKWWSCSIGVVTTAVRCTFFTPSYKRLFHALFSTHTGCHFRAPANGGLLRFAAGLSPEHVVRIPANPAGDCPRSRHETHEYLSRRGNFSFELRAKNLVANRSLSKQTCRAELIATAVAGWGTDRIFYHFLSLSNSSLILSSKTLWITLLKFWLIFMLLTFRGELLFTSHRYISTILEAVYINFIRCDKISSSNYSQISSSNSRWFSSFFYPGSGTLHFMTSQFKRYKKYLNSKMMKPLSQIFASLTRQRLEPFEKIQ